MDTVILLDVGNTNVKIGLARPGQGLAACYALPAAPAGNVDTPDAWGLKLLDICRVENVTPGEVTGFAAASVVPPMNPVLARAVERFFGQTVRFVPGEDPGGIPIPIENRYARPAEVGADRLVTAYAARQICDAPALVVVDFGTATTFDCVLGNAFVGGLICPGVLSSARALATGTAKLPLLVCLGAGWWYIQALPEPQFEMVMLRSERISGFLKYFQVFAGLAALGALALAVKTPSRIRFPLALLVLLTGWGIIGSFEFVREAARKPYLLYDHTYSNGIHKGEVGLLSQGEGAQGLFNGRGGHAAVVVAEFGHGKAAQLGHLVRGGWLKDIHGHLGRAAEQGKGKWQGKGFQPHRCSRACCFEWVCFSIASASCPGKHGVPAGGSPLPGQKALFRVAFAPQGVQRDVLLQGGSSPSYLSPFSSTS